MRKFWKFLSRLTFMLATASMIAGIVLNLTAPASAYAFDRPPELIKKGESSSEESSTSSEESSSSEAPGGSECDESNPDCEKLEDPGNSGSYDGDDITIVVFKAGTAEYEVSVPGPGETACNGPYCIRVGEDGSINWYIDCTGLSPSQCKDISHIQFWSTPGEEPEWYPFCRYTGNDTWVADLTQDLGTLGANDIYPVPDTGCPSIPKYTYCDLQLDGSYVLVVDSLVPPDANDSAPVGGTCPDPLPRYTYCQLQDDGVSYQLVVDSFIPPSPDDTEPVDGMCPGPMTYDYCAYQADGTYLITRGSTIPPGSMDISPIPANGICEPYSYCQWDEGTALFAFVTSWEPMSAGNGDVEDEQGICPQPYTYCQWNEQTELFAYVVTWLPMTANDMEDDEGICPEPLSYCQWNPETELFTFVTTWEPMTDSDVADEEGVCPSPITYCLWDETTNTYSLVTAYNPILGERDRYPAQNNMCDPLELAFFCTDDPENPNGWTITNRNDFAVDYVWVIDGSALGGVGTIPAHYYQSFKTPYAAGMLRIYVDRELQAMVAPQECPTFSSTSSSEESSSSVTSSQPGIPVTGPKAVITPTPPATGGGPLIPVTGLDTTGGLRGGLLVNLGLGFFGLSLVFGGIGQFARKEEEESAR